MKLLNFEYEGICHFGLAIESSAVSFDHLLGGSEEQRKTLAGMMAYLENLPDSFKLARDLQNKARGMIERKDVDGFLPLSSVRIRPILSRPAALIDFGLTPRHLINSAKTMFKHQFGTVIGGLAAAVLARKIKQMGGVAPHPYYKSNHLTVIGDNDEISWPAYTSYLDIEPELGIVTGNWPDKIAGYTIFNDASARDIQFPEMIGTGPARSKDFARGNGLGPFLVTPDEVGDPLNLKVDVNVNDRFYWQGHTSEYSILPAEVVTYLETIFDVEPGMVVGMGTIPGCTGMDNDLWLLPGDMVRITFEKLGTLHQRIPASLPRLEPSKWTRRPELERHQDQQVTYGNRGFGSKPGRY